MKKVSVVIPAYNMADLTVMTVESVLNQTYKNIEVIVVDDGSTDNTRQRLIPYTDRIKYVYKENEGACSARNLGIRLAKGDYIGLLDCDDIYLPYKIEKSVEYLEKHPDFGFVHNRVIFIDENNRFLRHWSFHRRLPVGWIAKRLILRNSIYNSTVLVRKSCLEKIGLFDERLFTHADWDMWLRLSEQYKAGFIKTPFTLYRKSRSYILSHLEQSKREGLFVLEKAFQRNPGLNSHFRNKLISDVCFRNALGYLKINDLNKAKDGLILSIQKYRFNLKVLFLLAAITVLRRNLILIFKSLKLF